MAQYVLNKILTALTKYPSGAGTQIKISFRCAGCELQPTRECRDIISHVVQRERGVVHMNELIQVP